MSINVAFVYVDSTKRYFAYVEGACVGQVARRVYSNWAFFPDPSAENIFPPSQVAEIHLSCIARAALLNLTARMLK
jgi:hypothetical protein